MILLLLALVALYLVIWFTSELPELWIGIIVVVPILQTLHLI